MLGPATPGVSRNAPCPCGSGKKYKKCCMAAKPFVAPPLHAHITALMAQQEQRKQQKKHRAPQVKREVHDTLAAVQEGMDGFQLTATGLPDGKTPRITVADAMRRVGLAEKFIYAYEQTGLMLTSVNKQLHPPDDIARWDVALAEYAQQHPEENATDGHYADGPAAAQPPRATSEGDDGVVRASDAGSPDDAGHEDSHPAC